MTCIGIGIVCACPLGPFLTNRFSETNMVSLVQHDGLRLAQTMRMPSTASMPNRYFLTSASKCRTIKAVASPTVAAPKREKDPKKRVVITGMGLVSVFGNDIDTFYDKLLQGESGISLIDRFDASSLPVRIGGQIRNFSSEGYIDSEKDKQLDDCWRYCLVASKRALENANLGYKVLDTMDKTRIGVVVGSGMGGMTAFTTAVEVLIQKGYEKLSPLFIPQYIPNMGSALLAIDIGLMGPNYCISTACATANYCFCAAANHIRGGEADIMVVGGTECSMLASGVGGFIACRALSQRNEEPKKASRPWDKDRDGFVLGEGSGVLIMESLESATKRGARIIAEYMGGAINCDAHHMTDPRSDGFGVSSCISKSLEDAGVSQTQSSLCYGSLARTTDRDSSAGERATRRVFSSTAATAIIIAAVANRISDDAATTTTSAAFFTRKNISCIARSTGLAHILYLWLYSSCSKSALFNFLLF